MGGSPEERVEFSCVVLLWIRFGTQDTAVVGVLHLRFSIAYFNGGLAGIPICVLDGIMDGFLMYHLRRTGSSGDCWTDGKTKAGNRKKRLATCQLVLRGVGAPSIIVFEVGTFRYQTSNQT
jgi:hypothetical protein